MAKVRDAMSDALDGLSIADMVPMGARAPMSRY